VLTFVLTCSDASRVANVFVLGITDSQILLLELPAETVLQFLLFRWQLGRSVASCSGTTALKKEYTDLRSVGILEIL
jgi:hypothetical protein